MRVREAGDVPLGTDGAACSLALEAELPAGPLYLALSTDAGELTGSFSRAYVEQLARKTGNYKKFSVFVEMLLSCFTDSPSVTLDLLHAKRTYLVVTYASAYDRVHYPLPLTLHEPDEYEPAVERTSRSSPTKSEELKKLKNLVTELMDELKSERAKCKQLAAENSRLRRALDEKDRATRRAASEGPPKYKVMRSKPLSRSASQETRNARKPPEPARKRTLISFREDKARTPSPFKRFDPTQYVKERNAKMEERRARSRSSSVNSRASSVSYSRSQSMDFARSTNSLKSNASSRGGRQEARSSSRPDEARSRPRSIMKGSAGELRDAGAAPRRHDAEDTISDRLRALEKVLRDAQL